MDDLLSEFLTETNESLDVIDVELVKFEQDPNNAKILDNIFRLVHTIKGTCGFLGLPRLERVAHAGETLMGKFRDGAPVTSDAVSAVLAGIDRIKWIVAELEKRGAEPEGTDEDVIGALERMSAQAAGAAAAPAQAVGTLVYQVLDRPLLPGEVPLDELERAFRETPVELPKAAASEPPKSDLAFDKTDGDDTAVKNQSIRVAVDTIEHLMTMVSELVLTRNQLLEIARRKDDAEFKVPLQRLSNVTAELQDGVMKTRMQPIGNAWQKLPRIVRDLARDLGKTIDLDMRGADTELDRQVLELIKDPLTHMVRNSADHGLEPTAERRAKGKPETGTISLASYHQGGHIIIDISDDGRGLDVARIKRKAIDNGLVSEAEADKLSEAQLVKFIFAPGFSTAAAVTNVSGRGVGMDVVKTNIDAIGGTIDVRSVPGQGTTFTIKIPLTLAIIAALIVESAGHRFAIPQLAVVELVRASTNGEHRIERIKDTPVLRLRNKLLPLLRLSDILGMTQPSQTDDQGFVVVTQVGTRTFGIVVDGVFHTEEIVVKPMSTKLRHIPMFSGNTILGDGSVILIVDPNGIATVLGASDEESTTEAADTQRGNEDRTAFLVFRAGGPEPKAVPLSLVTRLEEIDIGKIEQANGRDLVQYRGGLMPLVYVNNQVRRRTTGAQPMLVFSDGGRSMGLVVDEIVDIVEDRLAIELQSDNPGTVGTAVIKGRATDIVDVGYYLPLAFDDWFKRPDKREHQIQRRLLFVDDSAFFRNMLTPVLKAAGYEVQAFASPAEALNAAKQAGKSYDVIVSDIEMPEMDGFAFAAACHADEALRAVPIIALSGTAPQASERHRAAGFRDTIAKFDRQGLIAALKDTMTGDAA